MYQKRDIKKAEQAISIGRMINHPAKEKFARIIKDGWIRNCPVTVGDVKCAELIYGPSLPSIQGRTRYQESPRVDNVPVIPLPRELYELLENVTLCADYHFVDNITVFHTISRRIAYRTVDFPISRSRTSMKHLINDVQKKYHARGFRIIQLHADLEFEKVREDILPIRLMTCGKDDHVPEVERSVQTQKNENRAVCHAMPYRCLPRIMIRELIKQGNAFLNAFGSNDAVGNGLSPRNIIDNLPHIDAKDLKYEFGEYVQLHIQQQRTNTMSPRTIGAIVLGPRNILGRYNFMSLETGQQIDGRVVARLPISTAVIERVEAFGREQKQPFRISKLLQYEWRPGAPIADDDNHFVPPQQPHNDIIPVPIPDNTPNPFDGTLSVSQGAQDPTFQGAPENVASQGVSEDDQPLGASIDDDSAPENENYGDIGDDNGSENENYADVLARQEEEVA